VGFRFASVSPMANAGQYVDLYEVVGVDRFAKTSRIRKAYLLKARDLHPDKNPDDPTAPARFMELKRASEILLDDAQRAVFDKSFEAHAASAARNANMNAARKKMRADLEAAEAAAAAASRFTAPSEAEVAPKAHLDAIRQRNAQFCINISQQAAQQRSSAAVASAQQAVHPAGDASPCEQGGGSARVRLRWAADTGRATFALNSPDALPTDAALAKLMQRFGHVSKAQARRPGEAVVTFQSAEAAARAVISAPPGFKVTLLKPGAARGSAAGFAQVLKPAPRAHTGPLSMQLKHLKADDILKARVRDSVRALRELLRRVHADSGRQPNGV